MERERPERIRLMFCFQCKDTHEHIREAKHGGMWCCSKCGRWRAGSRTIEYDAQEEAFRKPDTVISVDKRGRVWMKKGKAK